MKIKKRQRPGSEDSMYDGSSFRSTEHGTENTGNGK